MESLGQKRGRLLYRAKYGEFFWGDSFTIFNFKYYNIYKYSLFIEPFDLSYLCSWEWFLVCIWFFCFFFSFKLSYSVGYVTLQ